MDQQVVIRKDFNMILFECKKVETKIIINK